MGQGRAGMWVHWVVTLSSLAFVSGCALIAKSQAGLEPEVDPVECPEGVGAADGDRPQMSAKVGGVLVVLCGRAEPVAVSTVTASEVVSAGPSTEKQPPISLTDSVASNAERVALSEFGVYTVNEGGRLSSPLKEVAGLNRFEVYRDGSSRLVFDEMVEVGGSWVPGFRSFLECKEDDCEFAAEKCVFVKPAELKDATAWNDLQSYISGVRRGQVPEEKVILGVGGLALSGDRRAQDIFLSPPKRLKLEGSVGETFSRLAGVIASMRDAQCL